jgi:hypothetical protein
MKIHVDIVESTLECEKQNNVNWPIYVSSEHRPDDVIDAGKNDISA